MTPENELELLEPQKTLQRVNQINSDDILKMRVPLHMVNFRFIITIIAMSVALMFLFLIELFYPNILTELTIPLITAFILGVIYFLTRYEISIHPDALDIKNLLFSEMRITGEKIVGISELNNFLYRHKKLYFSIFGLMILAVIVFSFHNNYRVGSREMIHISTAIFSPLMCTILFFNAYRMSHYPKAIKIDINPGEIRLYPENEEKYLLLKEKLEYMLR